jgi:hypothetical protein
MIGQNIVSLMATPDVVRPEICGSWLTEHNIAMIYGTRGCGKSTIAMGLALAASGGFSYLMADWKPEKKYRVAYFDSEMGAESLKLKFRQVDQANSTAIHKNQLQIITPKDMGGTWAKLSDKEGWLVSPESAQPLQTLTGNLRPGLTLVVGNPKFWEGMPLGVVKASLKNDDPQLVLDTLGSMVQGNTKMQNAAAAVVRVSSPQVVAMPEVVTKAPKFKMPDWLKRRSEIYLANPSEASKRRRTMLTGVGFLILLLLLVGAWQFRKHQQAIKTSAQSVQLDELMYKYREAVALTQLNPARSREILQEVVPQIKELSEKMGKKKDPRLAEIETGLPAVLGAATGTKSPTPEVVLDLTLLRSDLQGNYLKLTSDQGLVVLDTKASRLVLVDPSKKKGEVVAGQDNLGIARAVATYPSKVEVVSDKGVVECSQTGSACAVKLPVDEKIAGLVDLGMYGGNIYLLDRVSLWRYQVGESGFGSAQKWLADSEQPDFSNAQTMTIDGSIWVGKAGGMVEKYVRGVKDNFVLQDLDQPLGQKIGLYTDEDSDKLYIWDGDNGRIVVVTKATGIFDSQYKLSQIQETTSFVVDEKAGVLYLLTGSKIWGAKL